MLRLRKSLEAPSESGPPGLLEALGAWGTSRRLGKGLLNFDNYSQLS